MKKEIIDYLRGHEFMKNLMIGVSMLIGLFIVLLLFLRIYTHHNRSIVVPDFSDLPVEVAGKLTKDRHLRYEIFDSVFIADKEKGVVIDQHPKPGFAVKKNRKIYFTINANSPERMIMPDIVGITLREARTKIDVAGLKLGKLSYRFDIAKNVVLEQQFKGNIIEPGDTIYKSSSIDLVLGKGLSNEKTMVPDLIGLTADQAKERAADAFFSISTAIPDQSIGKDETANTYVYRQHPPHNKGTLVPLGSPITLWVTIDSIKLKGYVSGDSVFNSGTELNAVDNAETVEDDNYDYDYPN
jgi:eukaryotic-like serine/threonine-protein kinase